MVVFLREAFVVACPFSKILPAARIKVRLPLLGGFDLQSGSGEDGVYFVPYCVATLAYLLYGVRGAELRPPCASVSRNLCPFGLFSR